MRRLSFFIPLLLVALLVQAASFPVSFATLPDLGQPRLKVVGQNCENYFVYHLSHSNASATTVEELQAKTDKIVSAFLYMDADIYAMVELEKSDSTLRYLTAAMNAAAGSTVYAYVQDDIADCTSDDSNYGSIMAGFIYKIATVSPYGSSFTVGSGNTYGPRMRGQFFRETSSQEMFMLTINHFKAMSDEQSQSQRVTNASTMLSNINKKIATDPDVLVMGDLNCETSEQAIQNIIAAGYTEMLELYDASAYSYYYSGNTLIDHALANASMRQQITGAGVFHVNTGSRTRGTLNNTNYHYSDHDAVMVGLALGEEVTPVDPPVEVECDPISYDMCSNFGGFTAYDLAGTGAWSCDATYGCRLSTRYAAEDDWLVSPEMDLSGATAATLTLNHNLYYDNGTTGDYTEQQTLHYTTAFTGDPATTEWHQIVIPTYPLKQYADVAITLPAEMLADGVRMALHTVSDDPTVNEGNYWEIRSATIALTCATTPGDSTAVETIAARPATAVKMLLDGRIVILTPAGCYDLFGRKVE